MVVDQVQCRCKRSNVHIIPEAQCISEISLELKEAMFHSGNVKTCEEVLFCLAHSSRVVEKEEVY